MKNLSIWVPVVAGVVFVLLAAIFTSLVSRNRLEVNFDSQMYIPIDQSLPRIFVPQHDGLNIIILRMKRIYEIETPSMYELVVETPQKEYRHTFSDVNTGDSTDLRIQFAPIENIQGQSVSVAVNSLHEDSQIQAPVDGNFSLAFTAYYRAPLSFSGLINDLTNLWVRIL